MRWLRRVLASHTAHLEQLFGAAIPWLQHIISKRPRRRNAIPVFKRREILFAVADQHGAIEFRVAADVIVVPWTKAAAVLIKPGLVRSKDTALEDRSGVTRRGMRAEMGATLKNRDARAAAGKPVGDSGPADPGANDRHIDCFG
jgi:hypothetical protein